MVGRGNGRPTWNGLPLAVRQNGVEMQPPGTTRVVAHRGFAGVPGPVENSLAAFERAIAAGADAIELDVRRTRDGVLVVHHDPELADGRRIADLDAHQLPPLADGQAIPTLQQALQLTRARDARVVVELKERGYEPQAVAQLQAALPTRQFEVISFDTGTVRAVEGIDPRIRTGILAPRIPEWLRETALFPAATWVLDRLGLQPPLARAVRAGADYVSVDWRQASPTFIAAARERGIPLDVWTVDEPLQMRRLLDAGVQGIVTDHTDVAVALRGHAAPPAEAGLPARRDAARSGAPDRYDTVP